MKRSWKLSTEERAEIVALLRHGAVTKDVAARYGVTKATLTMIAQANGIHLPGRWARHRAIKPRAIELYRGGASTYEIEAELGVGRETIRLWVVADGVERRA